MVNLTLNSAPYNLYIPHPDLCQVSTLIIMQVIANDYKN